jgi:hypothetical protein
MILAIAKETLSRTRRRRKRTVDSVYWQDHQAWNWGAFTRRGVRPEGIVLSSDLKGRLVEEDWKILLGYYFPARLHLRFIALLRFFTFIVPALLLALSSGVVQLVYGFASGYEFSRALGPSISLLTFILLFHNSKRLFLMEDLSKVRSVGAEPLLSLFQKIDRLGLPGVEKGKRRNGWSAFLWPTPNIRERIENLRSILEQSPSFLAA